MHILIDCELNRKFNIQTSFVVSWPSLVPRWILLYQESKLTPLCCNRERWVCDSSNQRLNFWNTPNYVSNHRGLRSNEGKTPLAPCLLGQVVGQEFGRECPSVFVRLPLSPHPLPLPSLHPFLSWQAVEGISGAWGWGVQTVNTRWLGLWHVRRWCAERTLTLVLCLTGAPLQQEWAFGSSAQTPLLIKGNVGLWVASLWVTCLVFLI